MDIELNFTDTPDITEDFGVSPGEGGVISVNEKTGRVVLTAKDIGAQETLVSGVNIKTINGNSLLGSGNINISEGDKAQVYRGNTEPTDENILIWIDTSEEPVVRGRLLTADGKPFITVDGKNFLVAQTENGAMSIPIDVNSIEENETLSVQDYISRYTGTEIDQGLTLAYTSVQPEDLGDLATLDTVDYATQVTNKPTIPTVPTDVSAFNNDAGYLTLATLPVYNGGVE